MVFFCWDVDFDVVVEVECVECVILELYYWIEGCQQCGGVDFVWQDCVVVLLGWQRMVCLFLVVYLYWFEFVGVDEFFDGVDYGCLVVDLVVVGEI